MIIDQRQNLRLKGFEVQEYAIDLETIIKDKYDGLVSACLESIYSLLKYDTDVFKYKHLNINPYQLYKKKLPLVEFLLGKT